MKILVLNASPKGKFSTTLQTALYLQALHPEHEFTFLPVGQRIKSYEKDFSPVRDALTDAELVLFCHPVYTFIAPYQLHRLIELIKADGIDLSGKAVCKLPLRSTFTMSPHIAISRKTVSTSACVSSAGFLLTWKTCCASKDASRPKIFPSADVLLRARAIPHAVRGSAAA